MYWVLRKSEALINRPWGSKKIYDVWSENFGDGSEGELKDKNTKNKVHANTYLIILEDRLWSSKTNKIEAKLKILFPLLLQSCRSYVTGYVMYRHDFHVTSLPLYSKVGSSSCEDLRGIPISHLATRSCYLQHVLFSSTFFKWFFTFTSNYVFIDNFQSETIMSTVGLSVLIPIMKQKQLIPGNRTSYT